MGNKNSDLMLAQKKRYDEYFTLYEDIAAEIPNYKEQLRGKRIICPCDWDESYQEALVYKEEGYVAPYNLISLGGTIKRIDIAETKANAIKNFPPR